MRTDSLSYRGAVAVLRTVLVPAGRATGVVAVGLLLFMLTPNSAWAALTHSQPAIKSISTAYGFVLRQEYSLARIERTYPDAALQVELARIDF